MTVRLGLIYRPNVGATTHLMQMIAVGRCWHFDAWLARDRGVYYFLVETRAGGRERLSRFCYEAHKDIIRLVPDLPDHAFLCTLADRDVRDQYERLNAMHWQFIVPLSQRKPDTYTGRSIAMHYVRAPSLDPMEGIANHFQYARHY